MDLSGRIAVCISGQIRTGVETSLCILGYLGDLKEAVDIFIHTWDNESESPWTPDNANRDSHVVANTFRPVDPAVIKKIYEIYQPLDMRVDNYEIYQQCRHKQVTMRSLLNVAQVPMFQSIWESNRLKVSHETLSNSKYNMVIRLRFDLDFGPGRTLAEDLSYIAEKKDILYFVDHQNKFPDAVEDICWITSSPIMDIICDFLLERETNIKMSTVDWQTHLTKYLQQKGVVARPFKNNNVTIRRNKFIEE